jgi:hypothetical protein
MLDQQGQSICTMTRSGSYERFGLSVGNTSCLYVQNEWNRKILSGVECQADQIATSTFSPAPILCIGELFSDTSIP